MNQSRIFALSLTLIAIIVLVQLWRSGGLAPVPSAAATSAPPPNNVVIIERQVTVPAPATDAAADGAAASPAASDSEPASATPAEETPAPAASPDPAP